MTLPASTHIRSKLLTDPKLTTSVRRVLRARGVESQDLDDKSQDTLFSAFRATNLPATEREARQYVHAIARHVACDWANEQAEDPVQMAFESSATDAPRAEDQGGAYPDGRDVDGLAFGPSELSTEVDAREAADLAHRVVARASEQHPRNFRLFWRAKILGEPEVDIAADDGVSAGRVRRLICDARKSMQGTIQELMTVVAVLFVIVGIVRAIAQRRESRNEPLEAHTAAPQGPTPMDHAAELRRSALRVCDTGRDAECLQLLDEAQRLDPPGDADPSVQEARARAQAGLRRDRAPTQRTHDMK